MKEKLKLMDDLMGAITQTEQWILIQKEDPRILRAEREFNEALKEASRFLPKELLENLQYLALGGIAAAYSDAATLYGIHIAEAMRDVAADPTKLSEHILERIAS